MSKAVELKGLARHKSDEIDLVMSAAYSQRRAEVMDYTVQPTVELWGQVLCQNRSDDVNISDLAGQPVGLCTAISAVKEFVKTAKAHGVSPGIREFPHFPISSRRFKKGEVVAGVAPHHYGLRHAKQHNLVPSSIQFFTHHYPFCQQRGGADVIRRIDQTLFRWKNDKDSFITSGCLAAWA
ncbi:MAG: transporter substrate-binding domain-containing protein [Syntrophotaleaceae bacterium]